jgi:hypothetical protein
MFMGKDHRFWALVAFFVVAGNLAVLARPESYDEHRVRVIEQLRVPPDATFVMFRSGWTKGGDDWIEATIQLTDEQYRAYDASRGDPAVWDFQPFDLGDVHMTDQAEPGWDAWWDGDLAVIVDLDENAFGAEVRERERVLRKEPRMAIRWVNWGHGHGTGAPEGYSVWEAGRHHSFCWAWGEIDGVEAARPCREYRPTDYRPMATVRATLDHDNQRLFVNIR